MMPSSIDLRSLRKNATLSLSLLGLVVWAGSGCGYFLGADIEYELRIGSVVIDGVDELGPIAVGTTLDDYGFNPEVLLCPGDDGTTYFNDNVVGDAWQPADGEIVVRSGVGLGGEYTSSECPEAALGAQARTIEDDSFTCQTVLENGLKPDELGPVVARVPQRSLTDDEVGCYLTVVVYRGETDPDLVVLELNELAE